MKWRGVAGALLMLWVGQSHAAQAEEPATDLTPTARDLSDQGLRQYQNGDYDPAIESFLGAFALSNNAGLLFNVAQAYRLKGDCPHAGEYYRRYLDAVPDSAMKPTVERRLGEMEACPQSNHASPAAPPVPPTDVGISARPAPPPPSPPPVRARSLKPAIIAAASALAFGATGVIFALQARSAEQTLSQRYASGGAWDDTAQRLYDDGKRDRWLSIASFVAAGASAGIATWLGIRAQSRPAPVTVAPSDRSAGLTITGTWRF